MRSRLANVVVALVISASLVAGAGLIYRQILRTQVGAAAGMQALDAIRESERISAEWGAEVGRVKNRPDADFDSLKGYIPRLAAEREAIIAARERMGELPNEIRNGIRGYVNRLRAKQELIERFKTDYAVVRNSQDFLLNDPEGVEALLQSAREGGRTAVVDAARLMVEELEQFIRIPSRTWQQRTGRALDALLEVGDGTLEAKKVEEIAAHVDVLLDRYKLAEDRFEAAVSNRDIRNAAAALGARIDAHHQADRISVDYLNYSFYTVLGLAVVYWISLAVRFFRGLRRRGAEAPAPVIAGPAAEAGTIQPPPAEAPEAAEAIAGRAYSGMLRGALPVAPAPMVAEPAAGAGTIQPPPAEAPEAAEAIAGRAYSGMLRGALRGALPVAPAPMVAEPAAGAGTIQPPPAEAPVREGGLGLTTHALVEAVFGKLAEVADELDRAAEAGEELRSPVAGERERSEEALAALLGRLAGARWGVHRLAAQARGVLEGTEVRPDRQRIDLRDVLESLLDTLDEARRARITAVLLPGAIADIDLRAFEAAMERTLGYALEAAARHPEGAGHVELTLTTREGRHCIGCIDHGPGPPALATGGAPPWRDTLDLDVARRLVTAQGGEFEATTYPPYGSRIRIWIPPATEPFRGDAEPESQRHDRYTIPR